MPFEQPTDAHFAAFCAAMEALKAESVHIHCIANYRVSAFVYRWRRDVLGIPDPRADLDAVWQPDAVWTAFIS